MHVQEFYTDPKVTATAEIILFFDKLFDSCNGFSLTAFACKRLRVTVSSHSGHHSF